MFTGRARIRQSWVGWQSPHRAPLAFNPYRLSHRLARTAARGPSRKVRKNSGSDPGGQRDADPVIYWHQL